MESIILVILLVCGQADTVIIKKPDQAAFYTHDLKNHKVMTEIGLLLKDKPVVTQYEDKRGICV